MSLPCFFVTDLHGDVRKYEILFEKILSESPAAVFFGGDLLPSPLSSLTALDFQHEDFVNDFLVKTLQRIRKKLKSRYPDVFIILGNDDGRMEEATILDAAMDGIWHYAHNKMINWNSFLIFGYSFIPPSPFRLKDWERYDVSRYVDPGCTAPDEGALSIPVREYDLKFRTIADDLEELTQNRKLSKSIFLFHSPPYKTSLDRAALDGKMIDHVPLDVNIGSIAIKRFIEEKSPLLTLHGHVHESARLTGSWRDKIGRTEAFNGSHDGPELSLIRFDPNFPGSATRQLIL